jgi:hypothetical protein
MTDDSSKDSQAKETLTKKDGTGAGGFKDPANWSTGAKVGAAVGSAAVLAALLYAGRYAMKNSDSATLSGNGDSKPTPPPGEQFESD